MVRGTEPLRGSVSLGMTLAGTPPIPTTRSTAPRPAARSAATGRISSPSKFDIDVTHTESGQRTAMSELALYTVNNGRIVQEEFLFK